MADLSFDKSSGGGGSAIPDMGGFGVLAPGYTPGPGITGYGQTPFTSFDPGAGESGNMNGQGVIMGPNSAYLGLSDPSVPVEIAPPASIPVGGAPITGPGAPGTTLFETVAKQDKPLGDQGNWQPPPSFDWSGAGTGALIGGLPGSVAGLVATNLDWAKNLIFGDTAAKTVTDTKAAKTAKNEEPAKDPFNDKLTFPPATDGGTPQNIPSGPPPILADVGSGNAGLPEVTGGGVIPPAVAGTTADTLGGGIPSPPVVPQTPPNATGPTNPPVAPGGSLADALRHKGQTEVPGSIYGNLWFNKNPVDGYFIDMPSRQQAIGKQRNLWGT